MEAGKIKKPVVCPLDQTEGRPSPNERGTTMARKDLVEHLAKRHICQVCQERKAEDCFKGKWICRECLCPEYDPEYHQMLWWHFTSTRSRFDYDSITPEPVKGLSKIGEAFTKFIEDKSIKNYWWA